MVFKIDDIPDLDFVIENNVIKGMDQEFSNANSIGEVILDVLTSNPDHVGQIEAMTGKETKFAEMRNLSVRCALWLKKQGVGSGDVVTLCTHNHMDTYVPFLALFYTGAVYNAWNYEITLKPARHLMKLLQPKVIFTSENAVDVLLETAKLENIKTKIIVFGSYPGLQSLHDITQAQSTEEVRTFRPQVIKNPDETGMILLSSGSSGFPKGVEHSHKNIPKIVQSFSPYSMKDVALWYSTCYWATGFASTIINILSCGTRIIHASTDVEEICKVIEKYKVQRTLLSPTTLTYFCKLKVFEKYKLESLEHVYTGGSKMSTRMFEELKSKLPNALVSKGYGMSECIRSITSVTRKCKNCKSVGFVMPCTHLKIIDIKTGHALEANKSGEICIKSPTLMRSYYKNSQMTNEAIDNEGWMHTGDIGYYDENGELVIEDRLKEIMKYQNHQVTPTEIEEVLLSHPDVIEASVVPIPHEIDGELPMAFVIKSPGANVTAEELVKLSASLGRLKMLWGGVKFSEKLPKTPSGKIDRIQLKEMAKTFRK